MSNGTALTPELVGTEAGTDLVDPNRLVGQIQILIADTLHNCVQIGRLLKELRDAVPHGGWLPYLEELPFGEKKAERLMKLAAAFENRDLRKVIGLSPSNALMLTQRLPDDQLDRLLDEGTCEVITMDTAKSSTAKQLDEALAHLKSVRKHNHKLSVLQEEVKELQAENEALKGHKLAPTVQQAQTLARQAADRIDQACAFLMQTMVPDDDEPADKGKVLNILTACVAGAQSQLQNVMANQVDPHLPG